jgi:hypothetical protein
VYERFTDRARKAIELASQAAQRFNHEYIGTEHILLGVVNVGSGAAAKVLENLDIDPNKIRFEMETLVQFGPDMVTMGKLPQTPRAKKVIEYAMEEARRFNHGYIGTEHLLLGLLRDEETVAALVLMNFGLKLDVVRNEILIVLSQAREKPNGIRSFATEAKLPGKVEKKPEPVPALCPRCGKPGVVRVLWQGIHLTRPNKGDIEAGSAILCSVSPANILGPPWICLQCAPGWVEVHHLAMQDYQLQMDKEQAVILKNFELAAEHRDAQERLRKQLSPIVAELLKIQGDTR